MVQSHYLFFREVNCWGDPSPSFLISTGEDGGALEEVVEEEGVGGEEKVGVPTEGISFVGILTSFELAEFLANNNNNNGEQFL